MFCSVLLVTFLQSFIPLLLSNELKLKVEILYVCFSFFKHCARIDFIQEDLKLLMEKIGKLKSRIKDIINHDGTIVSCRSFWKLTF